MKDKLPEYFDTKDTNVYSGVKQIYNLLGHSVKGMFKCYVKLNDDYYLWVSALSKKMTDGSIKHIKNWENWISKDGTELKQIDRGNTENHVSESVSENHDRVVFLKDTFGDKKACFAGVFRIAKREIKDGDCITYFKRVATKIETSELMK